MKRHSEVRGRWTGRRLDPTDFSRHDFLHTGGFLPPGEKMNLSPVMGIAAHDAKKGEIVTLVPGGLTERRYTTHNPTLYALYSTVDPEIAARFRDKFRDMYPQIAEDWNSVVRTGKRPLEPELIASAGPELHFVFREGIARGTPVVTLAAIAARYRKQAKQIAGDRQILRAVVGKHEKMVVVCRDRDRRIVRRTSCGAAAEEAHQKLQDAVLRLFEVPLHMQRDPPAVQPFPWHE